jgi:hypothetical protein
MLMCGSLPVFDIQYSLFNIQYSVYPQSRREFPILADDSGAAQFPCGRPARLFLCADDVACVARRFWLSLGDHQLADDLATHEVLLNDPLERLGVAMAVPHAVGLHDEDRAAFADVEAGTLGAENLVRLAELQFLQPLAEKLPSRFHFAATGALGGIAVGTHEQLPLDLRQAQLLRLAAGFFQGMFAQVRSPRGWGNYFYAACCPKN